MLWSTPSSWFMHWVHQQYVHHSLHQPADQNISEKAVIVGPIGGVNWYNDRQRPGTPFLKHFLRIQNPLWNLNRGSGAWSWNFEGSPVLTNLQPLSSNANFEAGTAVFTERGAMEQTATIPIHKLITGLDGQGQFIKHERRDTGHKQLMFADLNEKCYPYPQRHREGTEFLFTFPTISSLSDRCWASPINSPSSVTAACQQKLPKSMPNPSVWSIKLTDT